MGDLVVSGLRMYFVGFAGLIFQGGRGAGLDEDVDFSTRTYVYLLYLLALSTHQLQLRLYIISCHSPFLANVSF